MAIMTHKYKFAIFTNLATVQHPFAHYLKLLTCGNNFLLPYIWVKFFDFISHSSSYGACEENIEKIHRKYKKTVKIVIGKFIYANFVNACGIMLI